MGSVLINADKPCGGKILYKCSPFRDQVSKNVLKIRNAKRDSAVSTAGKKSTTTKSN